MELLIAFLLVCVAMLAILRFAYSEGSHVVFCRPQTDGSILITDIGTHLAIVQKDGFITYLRECSSFKRKRIKCIAKHFDRVWEDMIRDALN